MYKKYKKCNKCKRSQMNKGYQMYDMPYDWDGCDCEKMDPCMMDPCKMEPKKMDNCCKYDPCKPEFCKMPAKCPSKAALTRMIQEIQFVCIELNLYLDTHPCDMHALRDFNCSAKQLQELIKMYECNFGPLYNFGLSLNHSRWQWIDPLWPWQN